MSGITNPIHKEKALSFTESLEPGFDIDEELVRDKKMQLMRERFKKIQSGQDFHDDLHSTDNFDSLDAFDQINSKNSS